MWNLEPAQIYAITDLHDNNFKMLEYGSGQSTKAFKRAGIDITSIEHNEAMQNTGPGFRLRLPEVRTHHVPEIILDWSNYIAVPDITEFTTILIDGECRAECLAYVAHHNPQADVWLHDTQRQLYSWATGMYTIIKTIPGTNSQNELQLLSANSN